MTFQRISILGVGLLGGSIGMAAKSLISNVTIIGYGHRRQTLDKAIQFGAIDLSCDDPARAVAEADLTILCTPVGLFPQMINSIRGAVRPGSVVTDVGSTKKSIVQLAEKELAQTAHFVGSHPMAGSEKRGVEFARPDLFQKAICITTPTRKTNPDALTAVEQFWQTLGMRIVRVDPARHDRLLADVSHLPHALASALIAMQREEGLELSGKGFLDTTRIAGGDGNLWRDIFLDNRDNLKASIARLEKQLRRLKGLLEPGKGAALSRWLEANAARREELVKRKLREIDA